jgi:hypothetical protein
LEFSPRRVNVFIGEPNTGKSNIIEALAVFSEGIYDESETFRETLRFKTVADLFYDRQVSAPLRIAGDGAEWSLKFDPQQFSAPRFSGKYHLKGREGMGFTIEQNGTIGFPSSPRPRTRFYRYKNLSVFPGSQLESLRAPYGANLLAVLTTNKRLRNLVGDMFKQRGFRLVINAEAGELAMAKETGDELYLYSYAAISETFRRIIFFMAILETNREAILLFDEPEANTYPFYTTYLAERIALEKENQFFLTTHNGNILGSIVGKTPVKELAVFVTTMEDYQTRLHPVPEQNSSLILDYGHDAFLNLDKLLAA